LSSSLCVHTSSTGQPVGYKIDTRQAAMSTRKLQLRTLGLQAIIHHTHGRVRCPFCNVWSADLVGVTHVPLCSTLLCCAVASGGGTGHCIGRSAAEFWGGLRGSGGTRKFLVWPTACSRQVRVFCGCGGSAVSQLGEHVFLCAFSSM
jgi:hypothetical protein